MTKSDKKLGKVRPKHALLPSPSRLSTKPRKAKRPPRFEVQEWFSMTIIKHEAYWRRIAQCRTLDEAHHQLRKPLREWGHGRQTRVRIYDTHMNCVVIEAILNPS